MNAIADKIRRNFEVAATLCGRNARNCIPDDIAACAYLIAERVKAGGTIYLIGNGGSAADCSHLAGEFMGFFYDRQRPPVRAFSLAADPAPLTAIANDTDYGSVFQRQVGVVTNADVLIALSTSGKSQNVLAAMAEVRDRSPKALIVALCGDNPLMMARYADTVLNVTSPDTPRIQELHQVMGHSLVEAVEAILGGQS